MAIRKTRVSFTLYMDDSGIGWEGETPSRDKLLASTEEFAKRLLIDEVDEFDTTTGVTVKRFTNVRAELLEEEK